MDTEQLTTLLSAANPSLTALIVNGPGLPSLAPIGRFRGLRSLHVSSINLEPGADFRALAGLKLVVLDLQNSPADYGRVPLSPLRRVTSLRKVSFTVEHFSSPLARAVVNGTTRMRPTHSAALMITAASRAVKLTGGSV